MSTLVVTRFDVERVTATLLVITMSVVIIVVSIVVPAIVEVPNVTPSVVVTPVVVVVVVGRYMALTLLNIRYYFIKM